MANILGQYGFAREQAHFKVEQEADIQALRKKLVSEGKLDQLEAEQPTTSSSKVYDADGHEVSPVLMEVLQASARLADPMANRKRIWELRRKAGLPPLSDQQLEATLRQIRYGVPLAAIVPSTMSLSTNQNLQELGNATRAAHRAAMRAPLRMTPEQEALARRQFMLNLRVAAYGSMASVVGVLVLATGAAHYNGIRDMDDLKRGMKAWGESWRDPLREAVLPVKAAVSRWFVRPEVVPVAEAQQDKPRTSEFTDRMRRRFSQ